MSYIFNKEHLFELLTQIPDPEIPVLSIADLGVIRQIENENDQIVITITPTYTGCPAMKLIEEQITNLLHNASGKKIIVKTIYSPAWTTDWISDEAKEKLRKYGIAPPEKTTHDKNALFQEQKIISCPQCRSTNSELISQFGSTPCKALYKCKDCLEPFDYFKCI